MFKLRNLFVMSLPLLVAVAATFALSCNPQPSGDGSGGSGMVVKTDSPLVLVKFGNKSITIGELASDKRFQMMVQDLILTQMFYEKCAKERIDITEADIEEQMAKMRSNFGNDEAELENYFRAQGKTMDQVREDQRKFVAITKLLRKRLNLTEEEIRDYYDTQSRNIKQTYANERGLTEEETEALTYEQVRDTADEMLFMQRANEVYQELRNDIVLEFHDKIQYQGIPPMTLQDWGIEPIEEAAPELPEAPPLPEPEPEEESPDGVDDAAGDPQENGEAEAGE